MRNIFRQVLVSLMVCGLFGSGGMRLWHAPNASAQLERLVVAVDLTAPFVWIDEDGALVGFDIDLIDALAAQAGLQVDYKEVEFRYLLPGVATRLYDIGSACIVITPEREAQVDFTRPYFATGLILVAQADNTDFNSIADLTTEMTIGVRAGSRAEELARPATGAVINSLLPIQDGFDKVEAGELHALLIREAEFLGYQRQVPGAKLKRVGALLTYGECGLAVNEGDPALLDQLDVALVELKNNGSYDRLYDKWFGDRPVPEKPLPPTPAPAAETAATITTPTPTPSSTLTNSGIITDTAALAGIYYLTVNEQSTLASPQAARARYQILTLAANGLWFVSETPPPPATDSTPDTQSGQPGFWYVNPAGAVEAMLLTFTTPVLETGTVAGSATATATEGIPGGIPGEISGRSTGGTIVIRKDYQLQVAGDGSVVGAYQTTSYPTDLFGLPAAPTAALTQTLEFTGQRVQ